MTRGLPARGASSDTPRLLLIGPCFPFRGGIAHYNALLSEHLRTRFEVRFFSLARQYGWAPYPGKSDRDPSSVAIEAVGAEARLDTLKPWTWAMAGLCARDFDVVVLPWWVVFWAPYYLLLLTAARGSCARFLFLCHNVIEHEPSWIKQRLSRLVLSRGHGFLVHSEEERKHLRELLGPNLKVAVSPHPSYRIFDLGRLDRSRARAELGIADATDVLLFFGFIRPYKGLDYLLRAYARICARRQNVLLLIVGESWKDEREPQGLIDKLGLRNAVRLVNRYVPNEAVEVYFKSADFLVAPYLSGTGSGVAQIAYSMRVPMVATRIGAFAGVIEHGKTGLLVPPKDVTALEKAVETMLDQDTRRAMAANIERSTQQFDWSTLVSAVDELWRSAV
ncbi:glycosyltransferase family 4 protein [Planctomycetota bacterium]